jgi:RsiW-degrading membrane proteinase PrsW (M82 family)
VSRVRTAVATEVLLLFGLCVFVVAAFLIERGAGLDHAVRIGTVPRLAFASVPALLWLGYFQVRDAQEHQPKPLVFGLFLAGALVAGPAADLLIDLASAHDPAAAPGFARFGAERVLSAFLVVGVAQEFAKYAVVRYTVYPLPEVAHPIDGLVYTTAVGLGFAAHQAFEVMSAGNGEVLLSVAAAQIVTVTLAHASFAAVLGLGLGWAKFTQHAPGRRALVLGGGVAAATGLNGTFSLVEGAIAAPGLEAAPWREVAFAFGFATLVLIAVSFPMRRVVARAGEDAR